MAFMDHVGKVVIEPKFDGTTILPKSLYGISAETLHCDQPTGVLHQLDPTRGNLIGATGKSGASRRS